MEEKNLAQATRVHGPFLFGSTVHVDDVGNVFLTHIWTSDTLRGLGAYTKKKNCSL